MKYLGAYENIRKFVNAKLEKAENHKYKTIDVYICDDKKRQLHTEPLCIIYSEWHGWFYEWLKKKFEEDKGIVLGNIHKKEEK